MNQSITLELPEETLKLYQLGAMAARKELAVFIVDRLTEKLPPIYIPQTFAGDTDLKALETLDDAALWQVAEQEISSTQQKLYEQLLEKNSKAIISLQEKQTLTQLGDKARRFTLLRSHAYMLLKWRGYALPSIEMLANNIEL